MTGLHLAEKRVLVTGAAGGIGREMALGFAVEGAYVLVADLNGDGAEQTAQMIREQGGQAHSATVDVTSAESCAALAETAEQHLGGLDVLINNAAAFAGLDRAPFWELDEGDWDKILSVNVKGLWLVSRACTPLLRAAAEGAIVNMASATVHSGSPMWLHYVASKGAVIAMTRAMAKELGKDNVRVNALAPGLVLTDAVTDLFDDAASYGVDRLALGRQAEAKDIVGGALYFASDLSGFVTGQTMIIDGGRQFI